MLIFGKNTTIITLTYIFMVTIVWYASNLHSKRQNTNNNENDYDVIKLAWTRRHGWLEGRLTTIRPHVLFNSIVQSILFLLWHSLIEYKQAGAYAEKKGTENSCRVCAASKFVKEQYTCDKQNSGNIPCSFHGFDDTFGTHFQLYLWCVHLYWINAAKHNV